MAISLRRSRRSTKKGVSDYNVGDIVEVSGFCFIRSILFVEISCQQSTFVKDNYETMNQLFFLANEDRISH